jgi:DHA2 family multidrug resistance protein-like MFS transporter
MNEHIDQGVQRATRREWLGLAVIALPCLLYSMDLTVLNLAVPQLSAELRPSGAQLLWIVDIYGFLLAGFLITMGTLGDRIGRRRLLLIGAAAFGLASILAAFSKTATMLIASRAILGIAGATLAPSTLSLIRNMFLDPRERTFAIGVWATSFSVGGAIGPLAGGLLLEHFWWGSVFLLAVPVMVLLLIVGPALLPEFKDPNARRLDFLSALLSLGAVLSTIYGLKQMAEGGFDAVSVGYVLLGLAIGVAFVRRQRRLADPMLDLDLFRVPAFSAAVATNALGIFVAFAAFFLIAQYLQLVLGLSPLHAGLWTVPTSGGFIAGSMLAPVIVRHVRPAIAVSAGLLVAAAGFGLLTQSGAGGLPVIVVGSIVLALGIAPVVTLTTDMIVGSAPPERAGAASAISETGCEFGGALGIALLGSLGTALYRGTMNDSLTAEIPPELAEAASSTLAGAVTVAEKLPAPLAEGLLETARAAFLSTLHVSTGISAVLVVAMGIVTALVLRRAEARPTV